MRISMTRYGRPDGLVIMAYAMMFIGGTMAWWGVFKLVARMLR